VVRWLRGSERISTVQGVGQKPQGDDTGIEVAVAAAARALAAAGGAVILWWWWRLHPTPHPFAQRLWIDVPHPFVTLRRLRQVLAPVPGERLLEVGVGGGRYALSVVSWLGERGRLAVLDLQEEMLALTMRRALNRSNANVAPARGDAAALPYPDDAFDAVYLVSTLGQVPDMTAALRELSRVVHPGGRVVVGELSYDPYGVFFGALRRCATAAGLRFERRVGGGAGYFARFTSAEAAGPSRPGGFTRPRLPFSQPDGRRED
jgi:SAM-dependent methyltransferase